jgi:hypothetical protein
MGWILLIVVLLILAYVFRVQLLAKVLGQPEERVRRMLTRRKNP